MSFFYLMIKVINLLLKNNKSPIKKKPPGKYRETFFVIN
jgi:hypothetical protein